MGDEGVADAVIFVFRFQNKGVWTLNVAGV